jgi:plastocyanin
MSSIGRPRASMLAFAALALAWSEVGAVAGPAHAIAPSVVAATVTVQDFSFTPMTAKGGQGKQILWSFKGPSNHTATDKSGMGLFNSGVHEAGSSYSFLFIGAGRYAYHCSIHPSMTGTVSVPIKVPASGHVGTPFLVTWSSVRAPAGFVFDVQVKKPGALRYVAFKKGVVARRAYFTPGKKGTYRFRARIRRPAIPAASGYSASRAVSVS